VSLVAPIQEGDLRIEPLAEQHREALQGGLRPGSEEIWEPLCHFSFDPEHFDASFDIILGRPNWQSFRNFVGKAKWPA
jgi:hypothetical protein